MKSGSVNPTGLFQFLEDYEGRGGGGKMACRYNSCVSSQTKLKLGRKNWSLFSLYDIVVIFMFRNT